MSLDALADGLQAIRVEGTGGGEMWLGGDGRSHSSRLSLLSHPGTDRCHSVFEGLAFSFFVVSHLKI